MPKYITAFFFTLAIFTSCGEGGAKGIIKQPQMTGLLIDIHIADGSTYNLPQTPDSLYKYATARYLSVFKKHHTDSTQFINSLKYYARQPEELNDIYTKVLDNLKKKTDSLSTLQMKQNLKAHAKSY